MQENILGGLIDSKTEKILRLFLKDNDSLFHLNKISKSTKIPLSTTFRIIKKLARIGIIDTIKIGKIKIYKTKINKKTRTLSSLLKQ